MKRIKYLALCVFGLALVSCAPPAGTLKKVMEENPDIIFNAIEKNPKAFMDSVQKAARLAKDEQSKEQEQEEKTRLEEEFKNPKKPEIDEKRVVFGNKSAPVTIVEYSDFECPYCSRGYSTVKQVMQTYGEKVRVKYKHLPLDFHPLAMPAARYYEAIALQSHEKAEKFHDGIFENQQELRSEKEEYLKKLARKVGANLNQVLKDINSDKVNSIIKADMEEAKKFEFSGTPGFLINGVSLRGAYPFESFKEIIDRHLAAGGATEKGS